MKKALSMILLFLMAHSLFAIDGIDGVYFLNTIRERSRWWQYSYEITDTNIIITDRDENYRIYDYSLISEEKSKTGTLTVTEILCNKESLPTIPEHSAVTKSMGKLTIEHDGVKISLVSQGRAHAVKYTVMTVGAIALTAGAAGYVLSGNTDDGAGSKNKGGETVSVASETPGTTGNWNTNLNKSLLPNAVINVGHARYQTNSNGLVNRVSMDYNKRTAVQRERNESQQRLSVWSKDGRPQDGGGIWLHAKMEVPESR